MDFGELILDGPVLLHLKENGVATITSNTPENLNAFSSKLGEAFGRALDEIESRGNVKVVVWTGAGQALSSGGDVRMLASTTKVRDAGETFERAYFGNKRFYDLPMPVIVAVNGAIAGVATGLSLTADILIASEKARFAANFISIGLVPDGGTSYFLFKKLGHHRAAEILFSGKILNASECLELGIFNRVVPHDQLYPEVYDLADQLAAGPTVALRYVKQLLRASVHNDFAAVASMEAHGQVQCWSTEDFREGALAFLEKRKPNFKGV